MNYNLKPVKYFVDVVQTHGFSSAAKRNYVSETAVSTAIKHLEDDLGVQLINRTQTSLSLTAAGRFFYLRAVQVLDAYGEIWRHPEQQPAGLLRIHFLQGLEADAAAFAQHLGATRQLSFDEEPFTDAFTRLLAHDYDILIGFELAFSGNTKLQTFPLRKVGFDVLCNTQALATQPDAPTLSHGGKLYLQHWKSTGIADIQSAMVKKYAQKGWGYASIAQVNSFQAAALAVNFKGGVALVPDDFRLPAHCNNLTRLSPQHLQQAFNVVAAISRDRQELFEGMILKAISSSYR